ncbi:hypothetical protein Hanom_Chr01g00089261 [Helianthus anomalus]
MKRVVSFLLLNHLYLSVLYVTCHVILLVNMYVLVFKKGIMEFNNPNFHQLAGNGPNFKNSHWRSQLLTFCKTLDPC